MKNVKIFKSPSAQLPPCYIYKCVDGRETHESTDFGKTWVECDEIDKWSVRMFIKQGFIDITKEFLTKNEVDELIK